MKTLASLVSVVLMFPLPGVAQEEEKIAFEYAVNSYEEGNYQNAANSFQKFMNDFPESDMKARAHFDLALSYRMLKENEKSKATFREILDEPYNERDGNSLMEPYMLYKHHSCRELAFIALEEKNYKAAENYIRMFDKEFPYQHFCGNEWAAYDMFKAMMYAKVYEGTNRTEKAVQALVPYIFPSGLASNNALMDELTAILEKHFTSEEIKSALNKALESLTVQNKKGYTKATIEIYGVKVEVDTYERPDRTSEESTINAFKKIVKDSELFKKYL